MGAARAGAGLSESAERARRPARLALGVVVAAGLAAWAGTTAPFSAGAEAASATGIALVAGGVALGWRSQPAPGAPGRTGERRWPWFVLVAFVVTWELVSFFGSPRVTHPTISSLYDAAARFEAVKAACFFAWLGLGAALVRR